MNQINLIIVLFLMITVEKNTPMQNWRNHVVSDKTVLVGKPTIKGTRLSVEFILKLYAAGWSEKEILENYPRLSKESLQAVFSYVFECMQDGLLFPLKAKAA